MKTFLILSKYYNGTDYDNNNWTNASSVKEWYFSSAVEEWAEEIDQNGDYDILRNHGCGPVKVMDEKTTEVKIFEIEAESCPQYNAYEV